MGGTHDDDNPDELPAAAEGGMDLGYVLLEMAVRELLIEQGVFTAADVMRRIEAMDAGVPTEGQKLVARFWLDGEFRELALKDALAACEAVGVDRSAAPGLVILENTPQLHHVVIGSVDLDYPRALLGPPPAWCQDAEYRARMAEEPRAVLEEFGLILPQPVKVRVVESTADARYLVVPLRPPGTEGMDAEQLAALVTRDSLIGAGRAGEG
jgi:nitrile hydratase